MWAGRSRGRPFQRERPACGAVHRTEMPSSEAGTESAMSYHVGRLIDHVHLKVRDLSASRRFYDAVLAALGLPAMEDYGELLEGDELCLSLGEPVTSGLHLAFQAADREAVHRFHAAAVAAGGRDNG